MQHPRTASLPKADAAVEAVLRREQVAVVGKDEIVADDAVIVIDIASVRTGARIVGIGTCSPTRGQTKANSTSIVVQDIALYRGITTASP